ncbi:major facilitator superfamily domain-containing protein [Xylogone sp. PMI_703]|nr:major facilitator superfamily domain-containing protein [Xylogone sp. PMI_703]
MEPANHEQQQLSSPVDREAKEKRSTDILEDLTQPSDESTATTPEMKSWNRLGERPLLQRCWQMLTWMPPWCRWDPENPPKFTLALNLLFGFAACFTVAVLYLSHPILNILADEFNVSYERASNIPTVMQAGYAAGLLFLCPLGDIFRRRHFVLLLIFVTANVWLGLCITNSFSVFLALSFIAAATTVTPQLMLPLVGDLAPLHRRAQALSIVVSGLLMGLLVARLLSGIITQYTGWRTVYFIWFGLQYLILILLWLSMPDYPSTNKGLSYYHILWSMVCMAVKYPTLIQACLVGFFAASTFTSFWTTLTFLLASPPYSYDSLTIGLFALIGIGAMLFGPIYSRLVIDRFVPLFAVVLGICYVLIGICVGTYTGKHTVAGPVIQALLIDLGQQTAQIANRSAIYSIDPKARNRVNTVYMVAMFCGQLMGTAAGNRLYAQGGWIKSGSASVGFAGASLVFALIRGPWEEGWIGWRGGWGIRRRDLGPSAGQPPVTTEAQEERAAEEGRASGAERNNEDNNIEQKARMETGDEKYIRVDAAGRAEVIEERRAEGIIEHDKEVV